MTAGQTVGPQCTAALQFLTGTASAKHCILALPSPAGGARLSSVLGHVVPLVHKAYIVGDMMHDACVRDCCWVQSIHMQCIYKMLSDTST